ncbi:MAG: FAD-dependent oxidoreductase [Bacteroidales bacterium]|nr:FAD-dependent oxidoreductase [Bacteroidales bacterium]
MHNKEKHVVIIGGGTAGCVAAGRLAREGYRISLIEKDEKPGGKVNFWYQLFPDRRRSVEVTDYLNKEIEHPFIDVITRTEIDKVEYEKGKFTVSTSNGDLGQADAVLVATGFDLFDAARKEEYGYGIYDNVITSLDLENMFHSGDILTTKGVVPKRVAIVHCVGSRDEKVGNFHCSKVCCVTAVKQAIEIKEHLPDSEVFCFYMDMRMFGPYYEELYRESQEKWVVNYIRGKVSEASENIEGRLVIKAEDTLSGRPITMEVDMLVLMVGMQNAKAGLTLQEKFGIETGVNGFFKIKDNHYGNNLSDVDGLFYAGTCTAPMNITDTISHARSAAVEITEYLNKN